MPSGNSGFTHFPGSGASVGKHVESAAERILVLIMEQARLEAEIVAYDREIAAERARAAELQAQIELLENGDGLDLAA